MNKLIILIGISGSGKSTWTANYIKKNINTVRINRDSLRLSLVTTLDGYYQNKNLQQRERIVNGLEDEIFEQAVSRELDIIIDNTNLKQEYINRWIHLSQPTNYTIEYKFFDVELEEAKYRIKNRDNFSFDGEVSYINKQYENYILIKDHVKKHILYR